MNAYVIITTGIVAGVLASVTAISLRFRDRLEQAFTEYVPEPGNDVEQRVLRGGGE